MIEKSSISSLKFVALFVLGFVLNKVLSFHPSNLIYDNYIWKHDLKVSYLRQGEHGKPALLLLPGFGAGIFHFNRNIPALAKDFEVFSMDLLGQGNSWPLSNHDSEYKICYSAENWRDQIIYFIEKIVKKPVHVAGNSLGGYLAICLASSKPDLVKSVVLMDATPFWSFLPARNSQSVLAMLCTRYMWNAVLPAPPQILRFGTFYFNNLRKEATVKSMLDLVYANKEAADKHLVRDIVESASNPLGQEVFTSILFSPKYPLSFTDMLRNLPETLPVLMLYGREDPWVTPAWAQLAKRARPNALYMELSPCGHCPHHEAPHTVNRLLKK